MDPFYSPKIFTHPERLDLKMFPQVRILTIKKKFIGNDNFRNCDLGLDFIKNLRPVNYKWKANGKRIHYGLTAQEVKTALIASGKKFEGN